MKLDLHNHTSASSDALTRSETLLRRARELDLVIGLTDHNNTASWDKLKAFGEEAKERIIYGEEIQTLADGRSAGELIGLFMNEFIPPGEYGEVIDGIRDQGALLVVPHPFDRFRCGFKHLKEIVKKVDLIEVYNSRTYLQRHNRKALAFAREHSLPQCAGSDSHTPEEIGNAYVEVEASDLEEARRKLLKGDSKVIARPSGLIPHMKTQLAVYSIMKPR